MSSKENNLTNIYLLERWAIVSDYLRQDRGEWLEKLVDRHEERQYARAV